MAPDTGPGGVVETRRQTSSSATAIARIALGADLTSGFRPVWSATAGPEIFFVAPLS